MKGRLQLNASQRCPSVRVSSRNPSPSSLHFTRVVCSAAEQQQASPSRIGEYATKHEALDVVQVCATRVLCTLLSCVMTTSLFFAPQVQASNVRLEDVESASMKAGVTAATSGDFTRAEQIFELMLTEDASSASVWSNLGNVHMSQERPEVAVSDYTHAISLAPAAPVPYLNRAIAYESLGVLLKRVGEQRQAEDMWSNAVSDCEAAIVLDPQEATAWFNKGNVEMQLGRFEEAELSFARSADLAPGIAGYRLRAAQVMFQNGEAERSARTMRSIVRKYPNYAEAHASLAAVLWSSGRVADAEGQLSAARELEMGWDNMLAVAGATRWPPALLAAMTNFLDLSS